MRDEKSTGGSGNGGWKLKIEIRYDSYDNSSPKKHGLPFGRNV